MSQHLRLLRHLLQLSQQLIFPRIAMPIDVQAQPIRLGRDDLLSSRARRDGREVAIVRGRPEARARRAEQLLRRDAQRARERVDARARADA